MRRVGLGNRIRMEWQDRPSEKESVNTGDDATAGSRFVSKFPLLNLLESKDAFVVVVELPGMAKGDVELLVTDESITLSGERTRAVTEQEEKCRRQERWHGHWSRQLFFPTRIVAAEVQAEMGNGILTIHLPKARRPEARRVVVEDIQSGS